MSEMDQALADIYGTGQSYQEKVAAQQEQVAGELQEMDKMAALESFKEAVASEGLDVDQYSDEQLAGLFSEYYDLHKQASAEGAAGSDDEDELVKRAWAEADDYGRQVARAEFIEFVKESADFGKLMRTLGGEGAKPYAEAISKLKKQVASPTRGHLTGKMTKQEAEKLKNLQKALFKERTKQVGVGAGAGAAGLAAPAVGAGAAGAGYAAGKKEKKASFPFLEDAIEKRALLLAVNSGYVTPQGESNVTKEGQFASDPNQWAGQYDTSVKTAFDEQVHVLALQHLEELGYPINWGGEE